VRPDLDLVAGWVPRSARVLDLGCGDGALLEHLARERGCETLGIDLDGDALDASIARGVPVVQADIDRGLPDLGDDSFDLVVLSQTLQATHRPALVLREMMRVGRRAVVSFPNFGHWRLRAGLVLGGRMPSSRVLPDSWHETRNIHLCTLRDFEELAGAERMRIAERVLLGLDGRPRDGTSTRRRPNLLAAGAAYLLECDGRGA